MMSAGGKAQGLNFDHVLHRLQTELQKSKETGGELKDLTGALTDIQDTLSGNLVSWARAAIWDSTDARVVAAERKRQRESVHPAAIPADARYRCARCRHG